MSRTSPSSKPGSWSPWRPREPGLPAQLSRWCASGRLLRLRRGLFALAPALLNEALRQGDPAAVALTAGTWRASVAERVAGLDWDAVDADVRPFLEPGAEMAGRGELLGLLGG